MKATVIEITPNSRAPFYIVTMPGRGDLCRTFDDPLSAIFYSRAITANAASL